MFGWEGGRKISGGEKTRGEKKLNLCWLKCPHAWCKWTLFTCSCHFFVFGAALTFLPFFSFLFSFSSSSGLGVFLPFSFCSSSSSFSFILLLWFFFFFFFVFSCTFSHGFKNQTGWSDQEPSSPLDQSGPVKMPKADKKTGQN